VSLEDFFETTPPPKKPPKKKVVKNEKEELNTFNPPITPQFTDYFTPKPIKNEKNIDNLFLLDVQYNGKLNLAQLIFYHEKTQSLYYWNDNTNHKPYLITMLSEESINSIDQVVKSKDYLKIEKTSKYLPIEEQDMEVIKVYGDNPLAIGGSGTSFRNFLNPSFEADIRYHFNYIADKQLTPATYYKIENGELKQIDQNIGSVKNELEIEFKDENEEEKEMLNEYMPLLFQKMPDVTRCSYDIEIGSDKNRLPNITTTPDPIISIALVDNLGRKICWVLKRPEVDQPFNQIEDKSVNVLLYDSELDLLVDFFHIVDQYPIALSFNGDNFDNPYLINRAKKLGLDYNDIPIKQKGRSDTTFNNSIHVDLYLFFRQASIRLYAFGGKYERSSLQELSSSLLGEGKIDHPEVWINEMDLKTLVKYNVKDAELTLQLTQFDNNVVLDLIFILMRICKMPIFDFIRTAVSGWLKMWLIYEHRKRNFLIPRKEDILSAKGAAPTSDAIIEGKKFQGAIVLDPKPGVWWNVHVLDFASLYPSIIKTRNLSYETILCNHEDCSDNIVPEVGHNICTKRVGLFAIVLGFVRDTRVKWFKPRSSDSNLPELERRNNDVIQSSLKVLINAGYGVFGSDTFDFYCPPVAESTTAYARDAIKSTKNYVENTLGVDVLYGDTDSVFLYGPTEEQISKLLDWGLENIGVELGTDYVFRYVVFSDRKKNYFGITTNGNIIVKGLMGKKSNTPQIIRKTFTNVLNILKNVNNPDEFPIAREQIVNTLKQMVNKLETGNFTPEDISVRITLSKKLSDYSTWTQTVQAAAQLLGDDNFNEEITVGSTIEYIKLKTPKRIVVPNHKNLAFPSGESQKVSVKPVLLIKEGEKLDGKPVIEAAESTFSQILSSIGSSWNDVMGVMSLDDFF